MNTFLMTLFLILIIIYGKNAKKINRIFIKDKGIIGEDIIASILSKLDNENYKVINDLFLKTNNITTQIDHVLISTYGIFIIETKNYSGIISGNDYSDKWNQNIYGKKYKFYNPVKQNYGHIKGLNSILQIDENLYIPIVVFMPKAELKTDSKNYVIYSYQLIDLITSFQETKFSIETINFIYENLISFNVTDEKIISEHISEINNKKNIYNTKIQNNICPKCNNALVIKKGKYGTFQGCSNYPKCRFTNKTKESNIINFK